MNFEFLQQVNLFKGCNIDEIKGVCEKLQFEEKEFSKNQIIMHSGVITENLGILEFGSAVIENVDVWGNLSVISFVGAGEIFAESYACASSKIMVDVKSNSDSKVIFVNISKLLQENDNVCKKIIQNLLIIASRKNMKLSRRIFVTSPKTIRSRLELYFSDLVSTQKSAEITIPFDRQQMADFLNVERTALCKELGKMQDEGLIQFHKNHFVIKI